MTSLLALKFILNFLSSLMNSLILLDFKLQMVLSKLKNLANPVKTSQPVATFGKFSQLWKPRLNHTYTTHLYHEAETLDM